MAEPRKKIRIGDLLVQNNVISEAQLGTALQEQKNTGRKLGRTLIDLGFIQEDRLLDFLSRQLDIPFLQLRQFLFNNALIKRLPDTL
ncbi:MAG: MSHA biogenesis protein MshE, partial [Gammaproteobacteria bacterium]|nr:MSHA biogenesis protein MshE [Gammaproteobacteria bacterium]